MRIAHVLTFLDSKRSYGGPVTVALGLAEEQIRQGEQVSLVTLSNEANMTFLPEGLSRKIFQVRKRNSNKKFSGLFSIRALYWLFTNRNKFDIFHLHYSRDVFQVLAGLILTRGQATVILQPHGMITNTLSTKKRYQSIYDWAFTNRVVSRAAGVVALQEIEAKALSDNFTCGEIAIVPNGIKFGEITDEKSRSKGLVVFVSRLHPQKDPHIFLDAALNLIQNGTELDFEIGGPDGGLKFEIVSRINAAKSDQLKFLGSLDNKQVLQLFRKANILVLPSIDDPYPMVVLEALSCGLEVVLSSSSGLASAIQENKLGRVFEPGLQNLEEAILLAISGERDPISVRQTAEKLFNISAVVTTLESVYQRFQMPKQEK